MTHGTAHTCSHTCAHAHAIAHSSPLTIYPITPLPSVSLHPGNHPSRMPEGRPQHPPLSVAAGSPLTWLTFHCMLIRGEVTQQAVRPSGNRIERHISDEVAMTAVDGEGVGRQLPIQRGGVGTTPVSTPLIVTPPAAGALTVNEPTGTAASRPTPQGGTDTQPCQTVGHQTGAYGA